MGGHPGTPLVLGHGTVADHALDLELLTGIEYDFWPYEEVTRRLLTVKAVTGFKHFKYDEVTLYGETSETRPVASEDDYQQLIRQLIPARAEAVLARYPVKDFGSANEALVALPDG